MDVVGLFRGLCLELLVLVSVKRSAVSSQQCSLQTSIAYHDMLKCPPQTVYVYAAIHSVIHGFQNVL